MMPHEALTEGRLDHTVLVKRGIIATATVLAVGLLIASIRGLALLTDPTVTAVVPSNGGPVKLLSAVQYKGVVVGNVIGVKSDPENQRVTMSIKGSEAEQISQSVKARILPRTLFGDTYIDLVGDTGSGGSRLDSDTVLAADTSQETFQFYDAFNRLSTLLTAIEPAQLTAALTAVAGALKGNGEKIGKTIDGFGRLTEYWEPKVDSTLDLTTPVATLTERVAQASPDLMGTFRNAVNLSHTMVEKKESIKGLFAGSVNLTGMGNAVVLDNKDRVIHLVKYGKPATDALAAHPDGLPGVADGIMAWFNSWGAFLGNKGKDGNADADFTASRMLPYGPSDCVKYEGAACGNYEMTSNPEHGGTVGPVGSPEEKSTLGKLADKIHPGSGDAKSRKSGVMGLVLGPMVRGAQVVTK
ncbi:MCE family protein [Pseudonocardiaceae bacterium YIM PH 21723]|nr:MCE family protein [Pseudonocardiaceae bacterium YIM PH 21723]